MLLAIDIGNTHTVVGVIKEKELLYHWRISSSLARTEDEIGAILIHLFESQGYRSSALKGVCISSVVPDLTPVYSLMSVRYLKIKPLIIDASLKLDLSVNYRDPETVGADRLCNAVAGIEKYGAPLIVIDFGTATTFDCINDQSEYLGGAISPGIETSIVTLHKRAAKLPRVELHFPDSIIGKTTDESIQSGILYGAVHTVEGIVRQIKRELGNNAKVVATGGLAKVIEKKTNCIDVVDLYLSLEGIASIYYKNVMPH